MADNVLVSQGVLQDSSHGAVFKPAQPPDVPEPPRPANFMTDKEFESFKEHVYISDGQFMDDLTQLKSLRSYMIRQAKSCRAGTIQLGRLNLLRRDEGSSRGRFPFPSEWAALEARSSELFQDLSEQDRRRFLYGQIPQVVIQTASILGVTALASLVGAVGATLFSGLIMFGAPDLQNPVNIIPQIGYQYFNLLIFIFSLIWAGSLGGVWSIAFIGMNALAVQEDATFDITNEKLIGLRVVIGGLLGIVLTLPFGFPTFNSFFLDLFRRDQRVSIFELKSVILLLPFPLGFSTTLVIMILNQFVDAVQSSFGKRSSSPPPPPPAANSAPFAADARAGGEKSGAAQLPGAVSVP
jgi:hypothetical protein